MSTSTSSLVSRTPSPAPTTPASTPPSSPEQQQQGQQQQQHRQRPSPGSIWFMPLGTPVLFATEAVCGQPGNHPVLVLPDHPSSPFVNVLFLTTINTVQRCNKKDWASNYLPIEEQLHPFRDPVSLASGSATLRSPSSINVGCVYTVERDCLRELNFRNPSSGAPTLSEAAMETVLHYTANKFHDHDAPWKPHAKQYRPEAAVSAPPVSVAAPVVAAPIVGLIAAPVAAVVSYASVASQAPIVTVEVSVSPQVNEAVGAKRKLSPGAKVFRPSKQRVHLVSSATA
ncbi:hypothetical protein D6C89_10420 [Aureobasidium pullulans]|nr:hypothetical protein D6D26_03908 [Aureobasidium pullulans]THY02565.1 hypothetical protein D6D03_04978 [Aureobasidium pullulans]THZ13691.1 hypothetical protein D6C89_10420 [Aureobasidium pullulans]